MDQSIDIPSYSIDINEHDTSFRQIIGRNSIGKILTYSGNK